MTKRRAIDISNEIGIHGGKDYLTVLEEENKRLNSQLAQVEKLHKNTVNNLIKCRKKLKEIKKLVN